MRCLHGNSIQSIELVVRGERFPDHSCPFVLTERTDRTDVLYGCTDVRTVQINFRAVVT
jgi:hypothetical protein